MLPAVLVPSSKRKRTFAPLPLDLAMLQPAAPLAPTPTGVGASSENGPTPEKVNVFALGSVSKFCAYVPPAKLIVEGGTITVSETALEVAGEPTPLLTTTS